MMNKNNKRKNNNNGNNDNNTQNPAECLCLLRYRESRPHMTQLFGVNLKRGAIACDCPLALKSGVVEVALSRSCPSIQVALSDLSTIILFPDNVSIIICCVSVEKGSLLGASYCMLQSDCVTNV